MIPSDWAIIPEIKERLGNKATRQRIIHEGEQTLFTIHFLPELNSNVRKSLILWKESKNAKWLSHSPEGCSDTIEGLLSDYDRRIDELDEVYESGVGLKGHFTLLEELNPILRACKNILNVLNQALQIYPRDRMLVDMNNKAHELEREVDLLVMSVKNSLEFLQASQLEVDSELNHRVVVAAHKLNLIVAIFLPLTAITSLFGMNLVSGLDDQNPFYFLMVLAIGLGLGLILSLFIGRFPAIPVLKSLPQRLLINPVKGINKMTKKVNSD